MNTLFNNLASGTPRHFLLYLNGIEVPCETATVGFGTWRFPEMRLTLPADPLLYRIGADDKLQAALMYLDTHAYQKPTYCLLSEGEIVSWGYSRSGNSRSMELMAIDPLATLTSLFIFYVSDIHSALGNTVDSVRAGAAGNEMFSSTLPLGFFYNQLNPKGSVVDRPIDFVLNIVNSVTGLVGGVQVFSRKKDLQDAISRSQKTLRASDAVKGSDIAQVALTALGRQPSAIEAKEGPTEFSAPGLIRYAASRNNLNLPGPGAQALYDHCKANNTLVSGAVGSIVPGALMFESDTRDPSKITHVGIVTAGGKVVEVIGQDKRVSSDDGYMSIHNYIAYNFESRGDPSIAVVSRDGNAQPGKSIAVGLIQHDSRAGTLFAICNEMRAADKKLFDSIMGKNDPEDLKVFDNEKKFRAYAFHANPNYWLPLFKELFSQAKFIAVQYAFDKKTYFQPAFDVAKKYGVDVERYITCLADAGIHIGVKDMQRFMVKAAKEVGTADKRQLMERFAYYADRDGAPPGKSWGRRLKILNDGSLSDTKRIGFDAATTTVRAGVVHINQLQPYRKIVGYGLIPHVDYADSLPKDTKVKATKARNDKGIRLDNLRNEKNEAIRQWLLKNVGKKDKYTAAEQKSAETWFNKTYPEYKKKLAAAQKTAQDAKTRLRKLKRAKIAIHFFMRWMALTKTRDKFISFPVIEDTEPKRAGLFPVLNAMRKENIVRALTGYSNYTSGNAGSMWDFIKNTLQIMMYDLGIVVAPSAFEIDDNHVIKGRAGSKTGSRQALGAYLPKPNMYFSVPPSCNVIFPSMIDQLSMQENYATQPTRTYLGDPTPASLLGANRNNSKLSYMVNTKAAYPPEVDSALFDAGKVRTNNKDVAVFPVEYFKGPITNRRHTPTWFSFLYPQITKPNAFQVASSLYKSATEYLSGKQNTTKVSAAIQGTNVVYRRGDKTYTAPFADDTRSDSKAISFRQQGYFAGNPVWFDAIRVENEIVHQLAGKAYAQMKRAARSAGVDFSIHSGFRTYAEQVEVTKDQANDRPGFSGHQAGYQLSLEVPTSSKKKVDDWLKANASKYGFAYADGVLTHKAARNSVTASGKPTPLNNKKEPRYVCARLPLELYQILRTKSAKFNWQQRTMQHQAYFRYAKYEHYREKYSSRTASGSGPFNPYLMAGFPAYVFDEDPNNFHLAGYLTSGTHYLNNGGQSATSWNMTHVRTFHEMFETMTIENQRLASAPADPITEVRDQTQRNNDARNIYRRLLYGGTDFRGKDPLGDFQKLLGYANNNGSPDPIVVDGKGYNIETHLNRELQALPQAQAMFDNVHAAMHYAARPVCTMEEYIDFYKGVRHTAAHPGDRILADGTTSYKFYWKIREFPYSGITGDPSEEGITQAEEYIRLKGLPQSLRDWQTCLTYYRQRIYSNATGT